MRVPATGLEPCIPIKSDGTNAVASGTAYTLALSSTYYIHVGGEDATQMSVQLTPANALLIASVSLEVSNQRSAGDVAAAGWQSVEPADLLISSTGTFTDDEGTLPLAKTNGAGSTVVTLPTFPWRRARLKVVVGLTGGDLQVDVSAKG